MKLVYTKTQFARAADDKCKWTIEFTFEDVSYANYERLLTIGDELHELVDVAFYKEGQVNNEGHSRRGH